MLIEIGIIVGEHSGDKLAAEFLKPILNKNKNIKISGIIGPELEKIGCKKIFSINDLSMMGFIDPIFNLFKLIHIKKTILNHFTKKIKLFIGIDIPDFNMMIEKKMKKEGIIVIHLVSPSIWAWRKNRIKSIKIAINLMLVIFPFEECIYKNNDIPVKYVGHPAADNIKIISDSYNIRKKKHISDINNIFIVFLPGSRLSEIKYHFPILIRLVNKYFIKNYTIEFIVPINNYKHYIYIYNKYKNDLIYNKIKLILNNFYNILEIADIIITSAGTASLESILYKKPVIVIYKMNIINYTIVKLFIKIKYISLPNIISKKYILNEFIQKKITSYNIYKEIIEIINNKNKCIKKKYINEFYNIHKKLKKNFKNQITNIIKNFLLYK